ncbi:MAG: beta-propeller fold lactonase family protein, partial [Actinobacteria bacterium]|nr:beta-propeller fold lactonase family protein [Actinomycetota bacterium]
MEITIRRTALFLVALSFVLASPVASQVSAAPVVVDTISVGDEPVSVAFSPNGKTAYVTNAGGDTVSVITVSTGDVTDTISGVDYPYSVAISPKGKQAYVASYSGDSVSV